MKKIKRSLPCLPILGIIAVAVLVCTIQSAQTACTISQVEENTVTPLSATIGTVHTVSTVTQLRNAITSINSSGSDATILLADGTYQIASTGWYPYFTANNIMIRSASGNRDAVIWRGGGMRDAGGTENGMLFAGNNITVADITIALVGNHGIQTDTDGGNNLHIYNVHFLDTYEMMIKGSGSGSAGEGADNVEVECSLFEYSAGIGPQYYIGGIDSHGGENWHVHDNVFKYIASPDPDPNRLAEHAIHFWDHSAHNTIERNKIVDCDRGIGVGLASGDSYTGGIIRNNMVSNTDNSALHQDVGIGLETAADVEVYNNTVYLSKYTGGSIEYRFPSSTGSKIYNNLTNVRIWQRDGASADVQDNITSAQAAWFSDVTTGDLHLVSAISGVVDNGRTLSAVSDDIDGQSRPQGSSYDLGADEYVIPGQLTHLVKTIIKGSGGSITPTFSQVKDGESATFQIITANIEDLVSVTGCGGTLDGTLYTTALITAPCTITARFGGFFYPMFLPAIIHQ